MDLSQVPAGWLALIGVGLTAIGGFASQAYSSYLNRKTKSPTEQDVAEAKLREQQQKALEQMQEQVKTLWTKQAGVEHELDTWKARYFQVLEVDAKLRWRYYKETMECDEDKRRRNEPVVPREPLPDLPPPIPTAPPVQ
jgi:hypothetical protein